MALLAQRRYAPEDTKTERRLFDQFYHKVGHWERQDHVWHWIKRPKARKLHTEKDRAYCNVPLRDFNLVNLIPKSFGPETRTTADSICIECLRGFYLSKFRHEPRNEQKAAALLPVG
jgi:hypothetical protein